jgi:hypothetical protein
VVIVVFVSVCALGGCSSSSSTKQNETETPIQKQEPEDPKAFTDAQFERMKNGFAYDPKAFTDAQFERVKNGFASINVGQMLIQRTHPTGSFIFSDPPQMILSADGHVIIGKVTARWSGGVSRAKYQTDFTIEITRDRVRVTTERDTALFQIEPNQLRLAELDLTNIVRPLY